MPERRADVHVHGKLAGLSRDTKYSYSVERIVGLIDSYMTFPVLEKAKLFRLVLFNFLAGNEDATVSEVRHRMIRLASSSIKKSMNKVTFGIY